MCSDQQSDNSPDEEHLAGILIKCVMIFCSELPGIECVSDGKGNKIHHCIPSYRQEGNNIGIHPGRIVYVKRHV